MKILFDLRDHPDEGIVRVANEDLARACPIYLERYGAIASARWWRLYDAGHISRTDKVGQITHVGPTTDDFGESCDIVRIQTDRGEMEYDREDYWLDPAVVVGRWIHIETVKSVAPTSTGPVITTIDVRVWLENAV
jgi:hypothetical protein